MGLDQYAWALKHRPEQSVDFELDVFTDKVTKDGATALAYWRKHPNLHGFIREIYKAKGGQHLQWGEFSGPVVLDREDIDAIETATNENSLPHTAGFFFGESQPKDKALTLEFCRRAREYLDKGWTVVYDSSW